MRAMADIKVSPNAETTELFELTMYGGAPESRYRRLRPDVERIDWDAISAKNRSESEVIAARRSWTAASLQEYATASAHALMLRALIRARVPLDLSAIVSRFPLDELAHAEICARIAGAFGGGTPLSYDRDRIFPLAKPRGLPPEIEAAEVVIQNCVSESWSHELLHIAWEAERHGELRKARGRIAKDEAGHGRFGWLYLDWLEPGLEAADREALRKQAARVVAVVERGISEAASAPGETFGPLTAQPFGARAFGTLAIEALEKRVRKPLRDRGLLP
jgi:hypothetical protein